jgi:hypothetical protein
MNKFAEHGFSFVRNVGKVAIISVDGWIQQRGKSATRNKPIEMMLERKQS